MINHFFQHTHTHTDIHESLPLIDCLSLLNLELMPSIDRVHHEDIVMLFEYRIYRLNDLFLAGMQKRINQRNLFHQHVPD